MDDSSSLIEAARLSTDIMRDGSSEGNAGRSLRPSILFPASAAPPVPETHAAPDFFRDLNLDQVIDGVTASRKEYDLTPFFYAPLTDPETISYRQEIAQDLEEKPMMQSVTSFSRGMRAMRADLGHARNVDYQYEKERWFLGAVHSYCEAIDHVSEELRQLELRSRGMLELREWLAEYAGSAAFRALASEADSILGELSSIRYGLLINGNSITVLPYGGEEDYTSSVEALFGKFSKEGVKDYRVEFPNSERLNHIDARILDRVARLNPEIFRRLHEFNTKHAAFVDGRVRRFDREVQFYLSYLEFIERFRRAGLNFCYPSLSTTSKEIDAHDSFDLALASRQLADGAAIVRNDFFLRGAERILVVSGPNHGGKTTFARMFGQVHFLAALGCPVPGTEARLILFDHLFTHFEREEAITSLRGKLQDDLVRIHQILQRATPKSIVIMNELFASTTLKDAIYLSRKVMAEIARLDLIAVCVTFLDELASFSDKTVSLVGTVDLRDPTVSTFRIERRPADGLAYALAVAEKYRVTYESVNKRIGE